MRAPLLALVAACGFPRPADIVGDGAVDAPAARAAMKSFSFPVNLNGGLYHDVIGTITDGAIDLYAFGTNAAKETAMFEAVSGTVTVENTLQEPGGTANDFTKPLTYVVHGDDDSTKSYLVTFHRRTLTTSPKSYAISSALALALGDIDGDGIADAVVASGTAGTGGTITVLVGAKSATAQAELVASTAKSIAGMPSSLTLADVTHDGRLDVIYAGTTGSGASMVNQSSPGTVTLASPTTFPGIGGTIGLASGDLNRDGYDDVVGANGAGAPVVLASPMTSAVGVIQNEATITGVATLDGDHDGRLDIALAGAGEVKFYRSTTETNDDAFSYDAQKPVELAVPSAASMSVGDIDGDGADDLLVTEPGTSPAMTVVYHLTGDGRTQPTPLPPSQKVAATCLADLDADHRADAIVVYQVPSGAGIIDAYVANASAELGREGTAPYNDTTAVACGSADFNDDGVPDIAVLTGKQLLVYALVDAP